jgi:hypothetical protein
MSVLACLEWLGMSDVDFGLLVMAWNRGIPFFALIKCVKKNFYSYFFLPPFEGVCYATRRDMFSHVDSLGILGTIQYHRSRIIHILSRPSLSLSLSLCLEVGAA